MTTPERDGELDGPLYGPHSGGPARQIILLLHGYGSNGFDLISFATVWRDVFPEALFLAPHAPERLPGGWGDGYQWWGLTEYTPEAMARGAASAAPVLNRFIDRQLETHGLTERDMALVGFSQGTMMALQVGPRRERQLACILGYSGLLTGADALAREVRTRPPVMLIHGAEDPMVPVASMQVAEAELVKLGFDVSTHVSPGLGHSVDQTGLQLGADFVSRALSR
jgi:phospholipase/carboxylesterase